MKELFLSLKVIGIVVFIVGLVMMKNSQTDNESVVAALVIILAFTFTLFCQIQQYVAEDKAAFLLSKK